MHIPENYLSPATCCLLGAVMVPVWQHALRKVKEELPPDRLPLLGLGAAFAFLGMMFNVPLPGGTTGHAVGGTLVALLFGPHAACLTVSVALLLQAVIFGDGGILALGANCLNMACVLPYTGYAVYRLVLRLAGEKAGPGRLPYAAAALGAYVGINLAACCAAVEFGVQPLFFTDAAGQPLYCPYGLEIALPAILLPHLLLGGVVEAAFTVGVLFFVRTNAPGLIYEAESSLPGSAAGQGAARPLVGLLLLLILATPLGLLAEGTAWGEWGAEEIAEVVTQGTALGYTPAGLADGWSLEAPLPDYSLAGANEIVAYLLSAVIGAALLVICFKLLAPCLKGKKNYAA